MHQGYPAAAIAVLAERLQNCGGVWVVGGSTGLAVRGARLDRPPRDLDIYADETDMDAIHRRLTEYALDTPTPSQTGQYRSRLSHYSVEGTVVELVGGFEVRAGGSLYRTEVREMLDPYGEDFHVNGQKVKVVPLAHELLFNVLRERGDRTELAASLIREQPDRHLPVLNILLERNDLSAETAERLRRLTAGAGRSMKAGAE
ncbi:hypothetical protein E5161_02955 [Cohnella pontilimi]|uniref:Nucleotidyl transferase AbiEii/AbiGii toxin family protein n=1 Tax=Cohnella pontilimi TaxID=2564100 RepID=A0A4U0FHC3_9BACL|nr:hypothetical protein [Cohnella pontilimi]TJY44357.1 hypothetical protein E5161_02955 [Cohnella pontilimi]